MAWSDKDHGTVARRAIVAGKDVVYNLRPHNHGWDVATTPDDCDAVWWVTIDGVVLAAGRLDCTFVVPHGGVPTIDKDHMSIRAWD